jgi:hypothetical protein
MSILCLGGGHNNVAKDILKNLSLWHSHATFHCTALSPLYSKSRNRINAQIAVYGLQEGRLLLHVECPLVTSVAAVIGSCPAWSLLSSACHTPCHLTCCPLRSNKHWTAWLFDGRAPDTFCCQTPDNKEVVLI